MMFTFNLIRFFFLSLEQYEQESNQINKSIRNLKERFSQNQNFNDFLFYKMPLEILLKIDLIISKTWFLIII